MKFFSYYNLVSGIFVRYIIYFSLSFSVAANLKKVIDDPPSSKSMMFPLVSIAVQPCVHRPTNFPFCVPPSLYLSSPGSRKIRHPVQIHLIGIRDSPDHRSVGNKEVKFIGICSLDGAETVSVVRIREGPYYRGFFFCKKIYENFVGTLETVRNRELSVLRGSSVRYPYTTTPTHQNSGETFK